METTARALKSKYILFIFSVVLIIVAMQGVIQYDLSQQNFDARLINTAGRQRMLSQRISKITLYLHHNMREGDVSVEGLVDTLKMLVNHFENVHHDLVKQNSSIRKSRSIGYHLNNNARYVKAIVQGGRDIVVSPDSATVTRSMKAITRAELPFLLSMEKTVGAYQREAEEHLQYLKKAELILSTFAVLILVLEFMYIFLPSLQKLSANNKRLINLNQKLAQVNNELVTSEQEIRNNLNRISELQTNLEQSEKQYRELVESAGDIIYELNDAGRFIFVNDAMENLTGFSKDEIVGKLYHELIREEDRAPAMAFYRDQIKSCTPMTYFEFRMSTKGDGFVWIGQNVRMSFEERWVSKVSVVARDITRLKETQHQLAEREERYRLISDNLSEVITLTDSDRCMHFVSPSCLDVLGYSAEELIGRSVTELVIPADLPVFMNAGDKLRNSETRSLELEFRVTHKLGHVLWLEAQAKPFFDEKQQRQLVQSSFRDITLHKIAEEKLAKSEEHYKLLSENMQDLVTLFSPDGRYTFLSPSVKDMLGFEADELLGTLAQDLVHPADLPMLMGDLRERALQGHKFMNPPFRLRKKDGQYIWVEVFTNPVADKSGRILHIQTTSRNISERKKFETELMEAKERAELATKTKSQFLGMMSHEIRTPMNAIIGLTNILLDGKPRKDQEENLSLLKFSGENLLTIINDILDFSKIEADKIEIESVDFELMKVIERTVKMLQYRADEKAVEMRLETSGDLPQFLKGDPVRLNQVINNLLSNAIKFTENGFVRLRVALVDTNAYETTLHIEVADTGIGISQDKLDTIFESFSQAESTTTRKYGGTGLGLTITRKLIQLMGSDIFVESTLNAGSRFYFKLTLPHGNKPQDDDHSFDDLSSLVETRNVRALLVEDNKVNQLVAMNFLQKWNIKATIANNGKEAVELIVSKQFDVVLMDLQMPQMNGYEATRVIRSMADPYFARIPIIALTASAMIDMRDKVLSSGMSDFLSKPFQPNELQRIIVKHVFGLNNLHGESEVSAMPAISDVSAEDPVFRKQLLSFALDNLTELELEFKRMMAELKSEIFHAVVHKCKMTMTFLNNKRLNAAIDAVEVELKNGNAGNIPLHLRTEFHMAIEAAYHKVRNEID